jgi:hypothetical protein
MRHLVLFQVWVAFTRHDIFQESFPNLEDGCSAFKRLSLTIDPAVGQPRIARAHGSRLVGTS